MQPQKADVEAEIQADLEKHLPDLDSATRQKLVDRLLQRVQAAVEQERQRCVETCRERVDLWRRTRAAKSSVERAREEARARANEAQYLADWLEAQEEPPEVSEVLPTVH